MPETKETTARLGRLLGGAYALWQERTYAGMAEAGYPEVRPAHSPVLRNIAEDGSRAANLAQAAGMTKQSIAYLVSDLQALDLVEVTPDPDDGRARLVRLTVRGRGAHKALTSLSQSLEQELAKDIGQPAVETLRGLLEDLLGGPLGAQGSKGEPS